MSTQNELDPNAQKFQHIWTRHKRSKSQVNGQTEMPLSTMILWRNAKAHRR